MPRQWAWIPAAAQLPVGLPRSVFKGGAETDADRTRGRWHCNLVCDVDVKPVEGRAKIGVNLGLKSVAKCSNGLDLEQATFYRNLEPKLAGARRRGRKRQVRTIYAKIANRRKDALHKFSRAARSGVTVVSGTGDDLPTG